jgi:RNA recognition motif-containing protein
MPRLFVGNLPFEVTDEELKKWFESRGHEVEELRVMRDRDSGKPRGFAFVTIHANLNKATAALSGQDFRGRSLTVKEARPMERRNSGGNYGPGRGRREPRW